MFKTKPQRPPPMPPSKGEAQEQEPRHHVISYYDPTGVWGLVAAGIQSRLPIKEIKLKSGPVIKNLDLEIVNFDGKAPSQASLHVSNLYKAPFINIMVLNGDTGNPNFSKKKSFQYVKDWLDKIQSSQWVVVVVQTVAQQNGIFNVSFFDKLRLEFPISKNRFCLIKFYEGQNFDQWNELSDKIRECFANSFDKNVSLLKSELERLDGSKFSQPWSFLPYYQVKECLAIMYEKANLLDIATTQYLELEDAYKKHGASEQKTNSKDRCFSAYFSSGSDSKLVIGKKYDKDIGSHFQDTKRKLGNARITRFDFHQYVVSKIIRLYFNQELYEQGLKKATLFINDSYKMMTRNKDVSPIFVQAWAYSASFSVADFCTKKIYSSLEETLKQQMSKDAESISSSSGGGGGGSKALSKSTDSGQTQAQAAASISKKDVLDFAFADSSKRGAFVLVSNLLFISKRQLKRLGYIRKLIPTHVFYEELREVSRTVGIDLDEKVSESPNPMDSLEQDLSGLSELDETASDVPAIVPEFGGNDPVDDDSVEAPILVVPTPEHRALTVKKISEPSSDSETSNDVQETAPAAAAVIVPKTAEPTVTSEPQKQQKENEVQNETAEPEQKKKEESDSAQQSKECDTEPELQAQSTTETLTTTTASSTDNEVKEPDQKNDGNSSVKQEENKEKEKEESQGSEASEVSKPEDAQKEDAPRKERISLDVQRDTPSIRISTEIPSRIAKSMLIKPEKTLSCAPSLEASQKASYSLMTSPKIAGEAVFDFPRRSSPDPYRASILSMSSSKKSTKKTHRRTKTGSCISITTQKKKEPSEFVSNMYNDDFTQDFNGKEVSGENIEEFERNVDDEVLMKSLRTPEDFDALLEDITRKSELAFDIAKRTRSAISSECDLAFHYFLRENWEQAEIGLSNVLHSLVGEGWEELACCMLVFLGYVQLKREEYSDYVSTCLKLLSYKSFDRKLEYSSMLMDIASNKLTELITKEIKGGIFVLTIKYPEDVETKEYHIGDSISLSCTIRNNLPIEFYIQSIEVAFTTEEGDKSFVLRNDEGSPIKVVANGTNSEFSVVATTEFHGVYHFSNLSFVTGNLRLVCVNEAESESSVKAKAISVVPVPPTTDIIAKFPKWLPKDINNSTFDVGIKIITNEDHITHGILSFTPESTLFSVDKKDEPSVEIGDKKGFMSIQQQQIELPAEVGSHSEIFVNVPINVFNKKNSLHTEMDFSFQTKLSGSVSHIKKDWDINFSEPFVMQYHQVPFRHDSIIVQIMLKSISSITLRIKSFKISPKDKSTSQFTGTIKKLTNMRSNAGLPLLRNSSSLSLRSSGKGSGNFQEDIVVLPENEVGIAYIFRNPPQVTEEWNFTLGYEFAPWSECEVVSRTFSSTFHMGLNNPEFIVNLSFPKNVIVGNIFDVKVSVSVNAAVGVKVSRENLEKMKMKVTACDPRQLIIQGFSQRIVDLSPLLAQSSDGGVGGENQQKPPKMEFVFRVITLHTGEIFVPRVEIMDSTNTNKARVLSEHPIILSLSDTHYILSSEREDDKEQSIENDSKKVSTKKSEVISIFDTMPQRISRVMNVVWVHSSASTIVSSTRCSQRMEGIKARLSAEQKIKMTIIYTTYDRWVATRDDKMLGPDKLKNIRLIVDERDRIASKVLLYVRQEPSLAEVPIIIFCEDKNKNWSEFSHLNNVFAANTLQDIEDTLTYNPSNFGFTSRGCTSIDSAPLLTSSVLNSSALSGFLTKSSGIVTTPQSRFHKLTRSQKK